MQAGRCMAVMVLATLCASACLGGENDPKNVEKMYKKLAGTDLPEGYSLKAEVYFGSDRVKTITPLNAAGKPDGLEIHKEQYGWFVERKVPYKNGEMDGMEQEFARSTIKGKHKTYLSKEVPWKNGKVEGVKKTFYSSGQVRAEVPYVGGKSHGESKTFSSDGKLSKSTAYVEGRREGLTREFYPKTGKPKREMPYVDGKIHGVVKEFRDDGTLKREIACKEGMYHGIEKLYAKDGTSVEKTRFWLYDERSTEEKFKAAGADK